MGRQYLSYRDRSERLKNALRYLDEWDGAWNQHSSLSELGKPYEGLRSVLLKLIPQGFLEVNKRPIEDDLDELCKMDVALLYKKASKALIIYVRYLYGLIKLSTKIDNDTSVSKIGQLLQRLSCYHIERSLRSIDSKDACNIAISETECAIRALKCYKSLLTYVSDNGGQTVA